MDVLVSPARKIKAYAAKIGFDACGFSSAGPIENDVVRVKEWLQNGFHAGMEYMENHFEKRCNPCLLVENACTVISVALNYYPVEFQSLSNPQIAYYAYGQDYHTILKAKLKDLFSYIQYIFPGVQGRCFCDTAPVLERYWAEKSGIGFTGKNTLLILPHKGSYFFLGEIIIDKMLEYDRPLLRACGKCTRCLDACPTGALRKPYSLDSTRCISYHTIENRSEVPADIAGKLGNCLYGCDVCQQVCPWNRFSVKCDIPEFKPSVEFLDLTMEKLERMEAEDYQRIFKGSAVKRIKYQGFKRNVENLKKAKSQ